MKIKFGTHFADLRHVDDTKFYIDGADRWSVARRSGTEPVLRVYARGADGKETRRALHTGRTEMNV